MNKKQQYQSLEKRLDDYRRLRPATAEMDITIFRNYCVGKNVVRIAADIPCSESTVYRAIHRVQDFLQVSNMISFMDTLRQHLAHYDPCYGDGDAKSALEMLYTAYREFNRFESSDIKDGFSKLYTSLSGFPLTTIDRVIDEVCALCHCHERDGFTEGFKLGVRMGNELNTD